MHELKTVDLNRMADGCLVARSLVYEAAFMRLRGIAAGLHAAESSRNRWSPTELVHETFIRRLHDLRMRFRDRVHFLRTVKTLLIQTQLDISRHRRAQRRWGGEVCVPLEVLPLPAEGEKEPVLLLRVALQRLRAINQLGAWLLELKYYRQYSLAEMAAETGLSHWQVRVHLKTAEDWLADHLPASQRG